MNDSPPDLHRWKLPPGRHGLPRKLVEQSQRERLMAAVVQVSASDGYVSISVADILKVAGVGRESFYKHFKTKEDCFLAANDMLLVDLVTRVKEAYEGPGPWPERVQRGLRVTLNWLAADPEVATVMMIEMGTVGPIASERFQDAFRRFVALLDEGWELLEVYPVLPNISSVVGGAVFARVHEAVGLGDAATLPELLPQLLFELLLPYIGEEAAGKERDAAQTAAKEGSAQ